MLRRSLIVLVVAAVALVRCGDRPLAPVGSSAGVPDHGPRRQRRRRRQEPPTRGSSRSRRLRPRICSPSAPASRSIAVDDQSDYPKRAPQTKLSGFKPNTEAIASYNPDLVVDLERRRPRRVARRSSASPSCSSRRPTRSRRRTTRSGRSARRPATRQRRRRSCGGMQRTLTALIRSVPKRSRHLKVLPRARARLLLGDLVDVHRPHLQAVRLPEHRRRGGHVALRLPAALGRVHRRREPRHRRARRLRLLRADGCDGRRAAGLASASRRCAHKRVVTVDDSIASRWGPRIVDFARVVAAVAQAVVIAAPLRARDAAGIRARGVSPAWALGVGSRSCSCSLLVGLGDRRRRHRAGRDRRVGALARAAPARPLVALAASRTRSSGSCARRASSLRRSSAGCSRSRVRRTRACSATRSPTRTCSASRPAPASARRS